MSNPLQDQLLKAGLVKKSKAARIAHEQAIQRKRERKGKGNKPAVASDVQLDVQRARAEKAEHDRALAAARNAQRRLEEARAQARRLIQTHKVERQGEIAYRFTDGDKIRDVLVNEALRAQLARGALVIVRHDDSYELLPRPAADKVRERDPTLIVLDHGHTEAASDSHAADAQDDDDAYYKQFEVPDDLIW